MEVDNAEDDQFFEVPESLPINDQYSTEQPESESSISPLPSSAIGLRRRSISRRELFGKESKDTSSLSSVSETIQFDEKRSTRQRKIESPRDGKVEGKDLETAESTHSQIDSVGVHSSLNEGKIEHSSVVTTASSELVDENSSRTWLVFTADLIIKAVLLQFGLLISLITSPFSAVYYSCMFIANPFGTLRNCFDFWSTKLSNLCNVVVSKVSPFVDECFKEHISVLEFVSRFGWGIFWAVYVCLVLCALLVSSFVLGGLITSSLVERPILIRENLNFDYTKNSPIAFVPIFSCAGVDPDVMSTDNVEKILDIRVVPRNHKLRIFVSLTLPESEYNKKLGIFQVRVDFVSANGRTLGSSRHPCMLRYISQPIRLLQTFLKMAPLITGYVSETQTLDLKFTGFTEGDVPTSCLKIVIEQRAEFRSSAGVPEVYDASLVLESELPLLKRIIWYWKNTLFIWISISLFVTELFFTLLCCSPLILPRSRQRGGSVTDTSTRYSFSDQ